VKAAKTTAVSSLSETGVTAPVTETVQPIAKPPASTKPTSTTAAGSARSPKPRKTTPPAQSGSETGSQVAPTPSQATRKLTGRPDQQAVDRMIAEAAYYLAEKRNFAPGWEEEDWETARKDVMDRFR
jgi:hypothetical protein